jgi:hypothetical protein
MTNRAIPRYCVQILCFSVVAVLIAGCGSGGRKTEGAGDEESPPTAHCWQYLYSYGGEDSGYATYSYVLAGRDESNETASALYLELVKAIRGSTVGVDNLPEEVSRTDFNVFLIPSASDTGAGSHDPDYELSKALLASLSTTSPLRFSQPGPYIITLYQPISFGEGVGVADILYIDFTNVQSAAIPEVVRTYKSRISDEELDGIERLRSLRLSLLNIALIAEDNIGFARAAYAGLRSAFSE